MLMELMVLVVLVQATMWEAGHQQLRRDHRADCELQADDGCVCSSWDRCDCCTPAQPTLRRADRRATGGWTQRCTTIGCCHLVSTDSTTANGTTRQGIRHVDNQQQSLAVFTRVVGGTSNSYVSAQGLSTPILPSLSCTAQRNTVLRARDVVHGCVHLARAPCRLQCSLLTAHFVLTVTMCHSTSRMRHLFLR